MVSVVALFSFVPGVCSVRVSMDLCGFVIDVGRCIDCGCLFFFGGGLVCFFLCNCFGINFRFRF